MSPELPSVSEFDTQRLINWIEEQRQTDRDQIAQLTAALEQLAEDVQEQGIVVARWSEVEAWRNEWIESVNGLREQITVILRQLDEHLDAAARSEQVQATQQEREARQNAELVQQVAGLSRASDAAHGRLGAIAEELRRMRDERTAMAQALDELQHGQSALQNRTAVTDEVTRRYAGFQSLSEQTLEKHRNEIARIDSQLKLLDLRLSRDVTDVRRTTDELATRTDERVRPIADLVRQTALLSEQRDVHEHRILALTRDLENLRTDLGHLDSQSKLDRAALKRSTEDFDAVNQRIDEIGGVVWQVSERVSALAASLEDLRGEIDSAAQRIDAVERWIVHLDAERQQLDSALTELTAELHADKRTARDHSGNLVQHIDMEVSALRVELAAVRRLSIDHLRRTVNELHQQLSELESDGD